MVSFKLLIKMNKKITVTITTILLLVSVIVLAFTANESKINDEFVTYIINPKKENIKLYWKDDKQQNFRSIEKLKVWLEKKKQKLEFAMNAGMYKLDNSAQGLFIENKKIQSPLDTLSGNGNFYMKPNGVFYITTDNLPVVCNTTDFAYNGKIKYATQSGPMLIIDGEIHHSFIKGSTNLNIRNGVGILPNNEIVFVMSKKEINFYDFADYFKKLGCENALYLDGFVSRTYLPKEKWIQTDGNFGVIIGVLSKD